VLIYVCNTCHPVASITAVLCHSSYPHATFTLPTRYSYATQRHTNACHIAYATYASHKPHTSYRVAHAAHATLPASYTHALHTPYRVAHAAHATLPAIYLTPHERYPSFTRHQPATPPLYAYCQFLVTSFNFFMHVTIIIEIQ